MTINTQDKAYDYFLRHLVGLRINYTIEGFEHSKLLSTFLFHHRGRAFLITAGHIFEEAIDQAFKLPPEANMKFYLVDHCVSDAPFKHEIPFEGMLLEDARFSTRTDLYDFAFIPLTPNYSELLIKNKLCHLSEEYFPDPKIQFEAHFIVGLPDEFNQISRKGKAGKVGFCVKHIKQKIEKPKSSEISYPDGTFFADIVMDEDFTDIDGMSGGPIFGLLRNEDGVQEYRLCAIQAGWRKQSVVVGCSPEAMLYHLNKYCDDLEKK